ncbi:hypothetical protein EV363DRAFT_1428740 [Boletus edulis]|uniref:Uncharacterized protein n=1 Tax=Boletus edulis BED1 TaxID=1328754 RepID=A0AAD4GJT6_BOLED|nr:hypothetical protein EV363DRAFT_1428740 [Boletus edulis]KAF8447985.1 hypothetical protein L210DRAFT_940105 [Boletus edulis BED1]
MCHNIIDGRYHTPCGHFVSMSTRLQDCLRANCLFSRRHVHPVGCKSQFCIRLMALPVRNPIRVSPTVCSNCQMGGPVPVGAMGS